LVKALMHGDPADIDEARSLSSQIREAIEREGYSAGKIPLFNLLPPFGRRLGMLAPFITDEHITVFRKNLEDARDRQSGASLAELIEAWAGESRDIVREVIRDTARDFGDNDKAQVAPLGWLLLGFQNRQHCLDAFVFAFLEFLERGLWLYARDLAYLQRWEILSQLAGKVSPPRDWVHSPEAVRVCEGVLDREHTWLEIHPPWLLKIVSDWCGHDKRLMPELASFVRSSPSKVSWNSGIGRLAEKLAGRRFGGAFSAAPESFVKWWQNKGHQNRWE